MHKSFKQLQKLGEAAQTGKFFVDAAGKPWPIYQKIIDFGAGPNAAAKDVAHGIVNLKADGHFCITSAFFNKAATAPVVMDGAALVGVFPDLVNVRLTSTANLTTYTGRAVIEYTLTTD